MATLVFSGQTLDVEPGESVLDCLSRHRVSVSSSCRSGICQSCMIKASEGPIPPAAQAGLKPTLKAQGCLLACMCPAEPGLVLERTDALRSYGARVERIEPLAANVYRAVLRVDGDFECEPGQFVQLVRPGDGLVRPYSIANRPVEERLELHVAELPGGRMSSWLRASQGEEVSVRGPAGQCFYIPGRPDEPLVLAGTGTGLAPLLGIVRSALHHGHRAAIRLYHGSTDTKGLYLYRELRDLERAHPNLTFIASVLTLDDPNIVAYAAPLDKLVLTDLPNLKGHRSFLCGHPDLVRVLRKKIFLAGAAMSDIHSDPFVLAPQPSAP